ncbi:MAG: hypothetical protein ACREFL_11085, partial [Stellaceae bacterium]
MSERAAASLPAKQPGRRPGALQRWWQRAGMQNVLRIGGIVLFLAAWEGGSRAGWLDPLFASSPSLIIE